MVTSLTKLIVGVVSQASVAVGTEAKAFEIAVASEHSKVTSKLPTAEVITGAVVSVTLIVCDAVDALPQASVAVHVLVTE